MDYEKLTGELYTTDITELIHELNQNKNKFRSFVFDRRGDYFSFEILHDDSKDTKKLYKILDKFMKKQSKGKIKREKNGTITDEEEK